MLGNSAGVWGEMNGIRTLYLEQMNEYSIRIGRSDLHRLQEQEFGPLSQIAYEETLRTSAWHILKIAVPEQSDSMCSK